jgi:hypothetical protein
MTQRQIDKMAHARGELRQRNRVADKVRPEDVAPMALPWLPTMRACGRNTSSMRGG